MDARNPVTNAKPIDNNTPEGNVSDADNTFSPGLGSEPVW
jgi:hypothetical protein